MTLFTLDIKRQTIKQLISYIVVAGLLVVFDQVYALFAHGVESWAMRLAWLYPAVAGLVWYGIKRHWTDAANRQVFCALNAGVASLTLAAMIQGVFEIAGTNSSYLLILWLNGIGWLCLAVYSLIRSLKKTS